MEALLGETMTESTLALWKLNKYSESRNVCVYVFVTFIQSKVWTNFDKN